MKIYSPEWCKAVGCRACAKIHSEEKVKKAILHDSLLAQLERLRQPRAGSIFNVSEEIAQEWLLRDMLGENTDDIPERLKQARERRDEAMMEGALR